MAQQGFIVSNKMLIIGFRNAKQTKVGKPVRKRELKQVVGLPIQDLLICMDCIDVGYRTWTQIVEEVAHVS